MPVNTAYLNVGLPPIGHPSQLTLAFAGGAVPNQGTLESSVSIPARLLTLGRPSSSLNSGALLMVGPDSALSAGLVYSAYVATATNTITLRFANVSTSTVTQRAATWGFGLYQGLP